MSAELAPAGCPSPGGRGGPRRRDRAAQLLRLRGGRRRRGDAVRGLAGGKARVLRLGRHLERVPGHRARLRPEREDLPRLRGLHPDPRAGDRGAAELARARLLPAAGARDPVRRPRPGRAGDPGDRAARLRCAGTAAPGRADLARLLGRRRADPDLQRLRGRGLPRRDRVGAPEPGGGRALARPLALPGAAASDPAAGDRPGDPAAPERLHRPAEGHRARRLPGRARRVQPGADLLERDLHLRLLPGGGGAVRGDHDPAGAADRLADRARPAEAPGRRRVRMSAVRLEAVRKSFGENEVLRGIDLELDDHELVCLIGASGSGKSTLLRCVNLLEPLDAGRIFLGAEEITRRGADVNAVRRRIGIVFQAFNLFPHMTVLRNVTLAPRDVLKVSRAEAESRALELLARFGLADRAGEYPDRLSGGQQQRVAIVRALAMRPELMLLDEVTSALDPELVAEVLEVIRELAEGGMTMLIATHEMGFARDIASRVCFLDDGQILEQGPPQEIFASPKEPRTQQFLERIIEAGRL